MNDQVQRLHEAFLVMEREAGKGLGGVSDPALDTPLADGRTLRQALHDLGDHYKEHIEQLLWTKWGQRIPRSEAKRVLAELQGLRAQLSAYFSDLQDAQLDVASASANNASPRDVVLHAMEVENATMELIANALKGGGH
ncbi:MAG: hypothetical protein HYU30_06615 [Chloroflexi bacterium]|nr:hypothetical protein [Chloroflexota bacterium]